MKETPHYTTRPSRRQSSFFSTVDLIEQSRITITRQASTRRPPSCNLISPTWRGTRVKTGLAVSNSSHNIQSWKGFGGSYPSRTWPLRHYRASHKYLWYGLTEFHAELIEALETRMQVDKEIAAIDAELELGPNSSFLAWLPSPDLSGLLISYIQHPLEDLIAFNLRPL